jgi:2-dehydro-3-deoxy-D-arabinonate dehydratase
MRIAYVKPPGGQRRLGFVEQGAVRLLDPAPSKGVRCLADILHSDDPAALATSLVNQSLAAISLDSVALLAPVDRQEIWAAGVTYKRSQVARMEESESGASHYDKVYTADRPELFFKSQPHRVSGPGDPVRVRFDSEWSVPEPEFTLVISSAGKIVGYTIGNDMSARDIEGENPLYLPQAKVYNQCCAIGPCILLATGPLDMPGTKIALRIDRGGSEIFRGDTDLGQFHRKFEDLAGWLFRENDFPDGALLLTGTGIVPPDDFSLENGDTVHIEITGIGTLTNPVVKAKE